MARLGISPLCWSRPGSWSQMLPSMQCIASCLAQDFQFFGTSPTGHGTTGSGWNGWIDQGKMGKSIGKHGGTTLDIHVFSELGIQTAQSTMHLALAFAATKSVKWFWQIMGNSMDHNGSRETDSNDSAMDVPWCNECNVRQFNCTKSLSH